jgi:hypothetical protein
MTKKTITMFPALLLGLMIASCEKIEQEVLQGENINFTASMDNIPLQYGRLVFATSIDLNSNILWFEQADQTIVGVMVNVSRNTISEEVIRIERK